MDMSLCAVTRHCGAPTSLIKISQCCSHRELHLGCARAHQIEPAVAVFSLLLASNSRSIHFHCTGGTSGISAANKIMTCATCSSSRAVAHPAPNAMQERHPTRRRRSASAPPSPNHSSAGFSRWDWEGKSIKFSKQASRHVRVDRTFSLQQLYGLLEGTPPKMPKNYNDKRRSLSPAVVSVCSSESPNPCCLPY